ncbi:hypothetical protein D049_3572B, partial [Vibrio parahaemolyticus VPTS-2010]
PNYL